MLRMDGRETRLGGKGQEVLGDEKDGGQGEEGMLNKGQSESSRAEIREVRFVSNERAVVGGLGETNIYDVYKYSVN